MPKITTSIELSEQELAEILAKHFNVNSAEASVSVYKYSGDQRDPGYTKIIFQSSTVKK